MVSVKVLVNVTFVYCFKLTLRLTVCTPTVATLVVETLISPVLSTFNSLEDRAVTPEAGESLI